MRARCPGSGGPGRSGGGWPRRPRRSGWPRRACRSRIRSAPRSELIQKSSGWARWARRRSETAVSCSPRSARATASRSTLAPGRWSTSADAASCSRSTRARSRSVASRSSASRSRFRQGSGSAALATAMRWPAPPRSGGSSRLRMKVHWSRAPASSTAVGPGGDPGAGLGGAERVDVDPVVAEGLGVLGVGPGPVGVDAEVGVDLGEPLDHPAVLLDRARPGRARGRSRPSGSATRLRRSGPPSPRASSASARLAASIASAQRASLAGRRRPGLVAEAVGLVERLVDLAAPSPRPGPPARARPRSSRPRRAGPGRGPTRPGRPSGPPVPLLGGPGLGLGLGQLGLAEPPLHAGQVAGERGGDHARVPRPVLRRGGQARLRQRDQLGVGAAGVEPGEGVGQVGLARPCGRARRPTGPRRPAGR